LIKGLLYSRHDIGFRGINVLSKEFFDKGVEGLNTIYDNTRVKIAKLLCQFWMPILILSDNFSKEKFLRTGTI
jgi:hypothetical protein